MNNPVLTQRPSIDDAILRHVAQYRITVPEAIRRLPESRGKSMRDVLSRLRKLESSGVLASTWLYEDHLCYFLTPLGINQIGLNMGRCVDSSQLSEETKIRYYAMLCFCCLGNVGRQRLTPTELRNRVADLDRPAVGSNYYVQADGPITRIGFLRVDMSGDGRWDRILAKCLHDAREHAYQRAWRPWIEPGRFEITLVTALTQKVDRLCRAITDLAQPPPVSIRITAIPELLYLIAPPPS